MSFIYTYGTSSLYESKRYDNVQDLLNQLQDNNANLIYANHVRDAVFSLWERVNEVEVLTASASVISPYFQNSNPTTIEVGGIVLGSSFSTPQTIQQMFDTLLYPYILPDSSISSLSDREYGSSTAVTLNWTATRRSNPITSILVDGQNSIIVDGNTQTGVKAGVGTYSTPAPASTTNNFDITVGDGVNTTTNYVTLQWMNRIYWGTIDLSSIGNPSFDPSVTNPVSTSIISLTSSTIFGLTGAGVSPGNQLTTSKSRTYTNINGSGNYLLFAWPSSVVGATSPIFTVNGLVNTAFSRVKSDWSFTNVYGFQTNYEVWISNTLQNSPLNIIIS